MSPLKKKWKEWKRFFHRYINGTRGVVSIFLAICMLPCLSINFLLLEAVRYQSVIEMLEELIDNAGLSALADYDPYLENRFGLMSLSQKNEPGDTFSDYLNENVNSIGKSATIRSVEAEGAYALSDTRILKQQILEYSEVMGPAQAIYDIGDIDELFKSLEKGLPDRLQKLAKEADVASESAKLAKELTGLVEKIHKVAETYDEYETAYNDYTSKYNIFEAKVLDLKSKIADKEQAEKTKEEKEAELQEKKKQQEQEQTEEEQQEEKKDSSEDLDQEIKDSEKAVQDAQKEVQKTEQAASNAAGEAEKAKNDYKAATGVLAAKTKALGDTISTLKNAASTLSAQVEKIDSKYQSYDDKYGDKDKKAASTSTSTESASSYLIKEIQQLTHLIKENFGDNYSDKVTNAVTSLTEQQEKLRKFNPKTEVNASWTKEKVMQLFGPLASIAGEEFDEALVIIAEGITIGANEGYKNQLTAIVDIVDLVEGILEMDVTFDLALNAMVPQSSLYDTDVKACKYAEDLSKSLNDELSAIRKFSEIAQKQDFSAQNKNFFQRLVDWLKNLLNKIKTFFSALADLLSSTANFFKAMFDLLKQLIGRVGSMFKEGAAEFYNSFLLATYGIYNYPCRTDFESGKSLTGYNFSKIFQMAGGNSSRISQIGGSIKQLTTEGTYTQSNELFYGAEAEYLAAGTQSEVDNQVSIFAVIYLLRFLMDLVPVSSDEELCLLVESANLATSGVAGTILQVIAYIGEPMLDTILLVNGGEEYFYKNQIYISPAGISVLIKDLSSTIKLSEQGEKNLKDQADYMEKEFEEMKKDAQKLEGSEEVNTSEKGKNWFKMDYKEHMLLVLMFTVDQDTLLRRVQNLIQMEAMRNYQQDYDFTMDKTYTYLHSNLQGYLNPMLPADRLTENGLFTFGRQQYTGY